MSEKGPQTGITERLPIIRRELSSERMKVHGSLILTSALLSAVNILVWRHTGEVQPLLASIGGFGGMLMDACYIWYRIGDPDIHAALNTAIKVANKVRGSRRLD